MGKEKVFVFAFQVAPPETFEELYQQVTTSKSKQYFILIFFSCIGFIFMFGLCCGRVTKRVRAELKNKWSPCEVELYINEIIFGGMGQGVFKPINCNIFGSIDSLKLYEEVLKSVIWAKFCIRF